MLLDKAFLRARAEGIRSALSDEEKARSDFNIIRNLTGLRQFKEAGVIFCFVGTEKEINTVPFILEALEQKKKVCIPKCVSKGIMEASEIKGLSDLAVGKYGIMEPEYHCVPVMPEEIDFAVVPCVTCDTDGNRIGHGAGYYDRYLEGCKFTTAVLCREALLSQNIPVEKNDVRIDIVITDKKVYNVLS